MAHTPERSYKSGNPRVFLDGRTDRDVVKDVWGKGSDKAPKTNEFSALNSISRVEKSAGAPKDTLKDPNFDRKLADFDKKAAQRVNQSTRDAAHGKSKLAPKDPLSVNRVPPKKPKITMHEKD